MGVDTVKLSYDFSALDSDFDTAPYACVRRGRCSPWRNKFARGGWAKGKRCGTAGPVWFQEWVHECHGLSVVVKGSGRSVSLLWEGSVPKHFGIQGAAPVEAVFLLDRKLRSCFPRLGRPSIIRFDVTEDVFDPMGVVRAAAKGWMPHARSRYVESIHRQPGGADETVWQHNKTRGIRVYDKFAEDGEDWAIGLTRVEYQVRGEWLGRYGLDRLYRDLDRNADLAIRPLVSDLYARVNRWEPPDAADDSLGERPV